MKKYQTLLTFFSKITRDVLEREREREIKFMFPSLNYFSDQFQFLPQLMRQKMRLNSVEKEQKFLWNT